MTIPAWHDDQQGTATVVLAGLLNALEVVGKTPGNVRIAMIGMGAANFSTYRMLKIAGVDPQAIIACDRRGTLHRDRVDIKDRQAEYAEKWRVCCETNPQRITGGIAAALRGSDVCIAFSASGPDVIKPESVRSMGRDAIVFACANPVPEIWPWDAKDAGARIVATGRSDFPNQLNNSLVFPGLFRGALDVRARTITDGMAMAAALELAACARSPGLSEDRIIPRMDEWDVYPREAAATAAAAQREGVARLSKTPEQVRAEASERIGNAREMSRVLQEEGLVPLTA
jgi:malate dehydrogenase (oxaloacetate-decarboxylating)